MAGQSIGKVMGAESRAVQRPSSELPVCLHSRAAAASTSVAPSGSPPSQLPPPHYHTPPTLPPLSCLFIYLWFPSTNPRACWYTEQRWRVWREEWMEGGKWGVNKGFVSGACRQHTCCLKRADIRAQQETVDGEGMEGWMSFSSSHHFLSPRFPTDELDN